MRCGTYARQRKNLVEVKIHLPIMKSPSAMIEEQRLLRGDATAGARSAVAIGVDGGPSRGLRRGPGEYGRDGEEGCEGID